MAPSSWRLKLAVSMAIVWMLAAPAHAQNAAPAPVALTLKRAVALALQNSRDIQVARIQASLAERAAFVTKAEFLPNVYAGSGLGYSRGIPETPVGRAPSMFSVSYTEQILNEPLRGQSRELQEQVKSQKYLMEDVRNSVILRTATAYLELAKVRHSLDLLRKGLQSAGKIQQVTQERQAEGLELPVETTKAQLSKARIAQRILHLEGREDELEVFLRSQMGMQPEQGIDVTAEDLPGEAEQAGADLVSAALGNNNSLQLAESDVRAKEFRLTGEKRSYLPTFELVSVYSVLARFNNYEDFFKKFQRNNFNFGMQMQVPIFSARNKANVGLARTNLDSARATLANKKTEVSAEVRQKTRQIREMDAAREVARLELQLAQQQVGLFQAQFTEGKVNLREVEQARLEENDKWLAFLDATFRRQQAQLDLLRTAGQLDKVFQ
jgi:outer membrane protein